MLSQEAVPVEDAVPRGQAASVLRPWSPSPRRLGADLAAASLLNVDAEEKQGIVTLRMSGVLVGAAAASARAAMAAALATGPIEIVADLSGITAADSSGAILLVAMRRHARRLGSSLRLIGAGAAVRRAVHDRGVGFLLVDEDGAQPAAAACSAR